MNDPRPHESGPTVGGTFPRNENIDRFIRAVEEVTGIPFDVLAARANEELDARKQDARREVLEYLGESAQTTPEEAEQIRREWQE